jgi:hypothetical protein
VASIVVAWLILRAFKGKVLHHAEQQLMQISPRLGESLPQATCPDATCPST